MTQLTFGLDISTSTESDPVGQAIDAEELLFDFVSASDHPCGMSPSFETWTMLAWVAARTTRIHVASRVLGMPYRPPTMVAKMSETLDRLSGGRLILGMGGGYSDAEFHAFGLGVPSPSQKVVGLREGLTIIRGLWTETAFTFEGERYHTDNATIAPQPARTIPIWLGTFGPRALEVTGQLADGWIPSHGYLPWEQLPRMRDQILAAAEGAGRDPGGITFAYNLEVRVDEGASSTSSLVAGGTETVVEQLLRFVDAGFSTFNFQPQGPDLGDQVKRLATDVLPRLHALVG